jgi:HEAT repeat protein
MPAGDGLWRPEALVRAAADPRPEVRRWALERLAEADEEAAEGVIMAGIADPDPEVAEAAIHWAAMLELGSCRDALLTRYRSADPPLAAAAATSLAALGDERVVTVLREREAAGRADDAERLSTWARLGGLPGAEARKCLLEAWHTRGRETAPEAVGALAGALLWRQDPEGVGLVVDALLEEPAAAVRQHVMNVLLPLVGGAVSGAEVRMLGAGSAPRGAGLVIQGALAGLAALVTPATAGELTRAWGKGHVDRCLDLVVTIVGELGGKSGGRSLYGAALTLLETLASRRSAIARLRPAPQRELTVLALLALDRIRDVDEVPASQTLPQDPRALVDLALAPGTHPLVIDVAWDRLADLTPSSDMVDDCIDALSDPDPDVRVTAGQLLGAWRSSRAVPALVEALGDDPDFDETLVDALEKIGEAAVAGVGDVLARETDQARVEAALDLVARVPCQLGVDCLAEGFERLWEIDPECLLSAVETLGAPELIPPLRRRLPEGDEEVRRVHRLLTDLHGESPLDLEPEEAALAPAPTVRHPGPKVGRNDPCPCGSGRKSKRCCQP